VIVGWVREEDGGRQRWTSPRFFFAVRFRFCFGGSVGDASPVVLWSGSVLLYLLG
jgi:hypothetical protein